MSSKSKADWKTKFAAARLPEKVVPVVLRGDLAAERDTLLREIERAEASKSNSLAGSGVADLTARLAAVEEEMADSVVEFRMRALPRVTRPSDARPSFADLKAKHPPRTDGPDGGLMREDMLAGFVNTTTFPDPLVRWSIIEPELTEAEWDELPLSQGQFDQLVDAAWNLNQAKVDVPFSSAGSSPSRSSSNA